MKPIFSEPHLSSSWSRNSGWSQGKGAAHTTCKALFRREASKCPTFMILCLCFPVWFLPFLLAAFTSFIWVSASASISSTHTFDCSKHGCDMSVISALFMREVRIATFHIVLRWDFFTLKRCRSFFTRVIMVSPIARDQVFPYFLGMYRFLSYAHAHKSVFYSLSFA